MSGWQRIIRLTIPLLPLLWPAQPLAAGFRDYATVLKVEPIVEGEYRTLVRQACEPETDSGLAIAASIGDDVRQQAHRWTHGLHCRTLPRRQDQPRITGYWVTYSYGGTTAVRRMSRDPGRRLPVDVRLSPRP